MLLLAGCSSPGVFVTRAGDGNAAKLGTAPADGTYGLFIAGEGEPEFQVPLKKGDSLGFDSPEGFQPNDLKVVFLYAVAKGERVRLDIRQTYEWRRL
jgi:hypothetical protein